MVAGVAGDRDGEGGAAAMLVEKAWSWVAECEWNRLCCSNWRAGRGRAVPGGIAAVAAVVDAVVITSLPAISCCCQHRIRSGCDTSSGSISLRESRLHQCPKGTTAIGFAARFRSTFGSTDERGCERERDRGGALWRHR